MNYDGLGEVLVPLAGIFFLFGLPVLAFVFFRVMAHRERMAMIQNGLTPGPLPRNVPSRPVNPNRDSGPDDDIQTTLTKGIRLSFIGFAITLGLSFIGYHDGDGGMSWHPGPWLLGGLIPMFIGVAQVIIALISGATLGPRFAPPPHGSSQFGPTYGSAPQPPPPPTGAASPMYDGSYTYRPGSTEQLRPPTPPPERR